MSLEKAIDAASDVRALQRQISRMEAVQADYQAKADAITAELVKLRELASRAVNELKANARDI